MLSLGGFVFSLKTRFFNGFVQYFSKTGSSSESHFSRDRRRVSSIKPLVGLEQKPPRITEGVKAYLSATLWYHSFGRQIPWGSGTVGNGRVYSNEVGTSGVTEASDRVGGGDRLERFN